jgi:hypothetical protein
MIVLIIAIVLQFIILAYYLYFISKGIIPAILDYTVFQNELINLSNSNKTPPPPPANSTSSPIETTNTDEV